MANESGAAGPAIIVATGWHEPIYIISSEGRTRVRNWRNTDNGMPDDSSFTWGYYGGGVHNTAYAILREFFGREVAESHTGDLVECWLSRLDQERGFRASRDKVAKLLGAYVAQRMG